MSARESTVFDRPVVRNVAFMIFLSGVPSLCSAEELADAIRAYLTHRVDGEQIPGGIVVGIVDEHGSRVVSYGKLNNGTDEHVDGDTLFEIGSVGKTFTALLLQDMIERGAMKLDDPVAKYLPESVTMPTHAGKEITLRHLATHTSGLPGIPDNLDPQTRRQPVCGLHRREDVCLSFRVPISPGAGSKVGILQPRNGIARARNRTESRDQLRIARRRTDLPAAANGQHADHADARAKGSLRNRTQSIWGTSSTLGCSNSGRRRR